MNVYKILGHNIYTDKWEELGLIEAKSIKGANQKAHSIYGADFYEFAFGA